MSQSHNVCGAITVVQSAHNQYKFTPIKPFAICVQSIVFTPFVRASSHFQHNKTPIKSFLLVLSGYFVRRICCWWLWLYMYEVVCSSNGRNILAKRIITSPGTVVKVVYTRVYHGDLRMQWKRNGWTLTTADPQRRTAHVLATTVLSMAHSAGTTSAPFCVRLFAHSFTLYVELDFVARHTI